jgi:DNA (cytosine-5)-methyltransferase 1
VGSGKEAVVTLGQRRKHDELVPRPRLLDLFCCEGGAATGYHRAGFDVVGVDIEPQPRYPFDFRHGDALLALDKLARDPDWFGPIDAIHASPPCQSYSAALKHMAHPQPELIDAIRERLSAQSRPWIIENVEGAPIPRQSDLFGAQGVMLCGTSFGLRVYRHRLFECSFPVSGPPCSHKGHAMNPHNVAGRGRIYEEFGRRDPEIVWAKAMGVEWMSRHGARESIPPAFTEYLGRQLIDAIQLVPENDGKAA